MVDFEGIGQVGLAEFFRLFERKAIVSEMREIKVASESSAAVIIRFIFVSPKV